MLDLLDGYFARRSDRRLEVVAPTGRVVGSTCDETNAFAMAQRHQYTSRLKPRACLCCQKEFLSEGAHNRLCNDCRQSDDDASYAVAPIRRKR